MTFIYQESIKYRPFLARIFHAYTVAPPFHTDSSTFHLYQITAWTPPQTSRESKCLGRSHSSSSPATPQPEHGPIGQPPAASTSPRPTTRPHHARSRATLPFREAFPYIHLLPARTVSSPSRAPPEPSLDMQYNPIPAKPPMRVRFHRSHSPPPQFGQCSAGAAASPSRASRGGRPPICGTGGGGNG